MSYKTNYIFEGEYCRKPEQRLGGRSVPRQTRDALIENATQERLRREKDRLIAKSIRVIQAIVRGFLARRRTQKENRQAYAAKRKDAYVLEDLGWQISRLNVFYHLSDDIPKLIELGKCILSSHAQIFQLCSVDPIWAHRIRLILRKAVAVVGSNAKTHHPVCLRLLEEFSQSSSETPQSLKFYTNTWLDLIVSSSFYSVWRTQLETQLRFAKTPNQSLHPLTSAMIQILNNSLGLITKGENSDLKFSVECDCRQVRPTFQSRTELTGPAVALRILEKFTECFCDKVIPDNDSRECKPIPHYVFPIVGKQLPWLSWINYLQVAHCDRFTNASSPARNLLYSILALTPTEVIKTYTREFFTPVSKLMNSIDPQYSPLCATQVVDWKPGEIDFDTADEPWPADQMEYFVECRAIYLKFAHVLNDLPASILVDKESCFTLELMNPILSCIIRMEPRFLCMFFQFPGIMAYNREFLRRIYLLNMSSSQPNPGKIHNTVVFAWILNHLLSTLHDAEFIAGIPMSREELGRFIPKLVSNYSETILLEKNVPQERLNASLNKILATCLMSLHDRNTRMQLFPEDVFYSSSLQSICPVETHNLFFQDFNTSENVEATTARLNTLEQKLMKVLTDFPFALPFHDRVAAWHRMIDLDRSQRFAPQGVREHVQIRRNYIYEDAYEKLSPNNVRDLRNHLRISLVNVVGAAEAGVDGGGLLREFLTEATKAGVDPNRGLFRFDSQNRIYPNPIAKKAVPDYRNHYFLIGRLVGKALYEQTLLELPLAAFFIQTCISHKVPSAVDYLATLDPGLHKQLLGLKNFSGDLTSLGLDFTITIDEFGETRTVNLKDNGGSITVDKNNVIEYIHLVADYKINKEMQDECLYFRRGLCDVVPILRMFSWREMQTLISGSDKPIDVADWIEHTNYTGGYSFDHPCIQMFWEVVHSFDEQYLRKLLKFVTSCSRPPLLGFKDLVPNFGIQNAGHVDRLPTSATCMNLLKLPEFTTATHLREKLVYAIDAQAGFELS